MVQAMLGNSDLKDAQNAIYMLKEPVEGARRWYVARDLGQTFGRTGALDPPRGDPDVFEKTAFITGVENGVVRFDYRGRHKALFEQHHAGRRALDLPAAVGAHRRSSCRTPFAPAAIREPPPTASSAGSSRRSPKALQLKD